jgi:hypothetical protein
MVPMLPLQPSCCFRTLPIPTGFKIFALGDFNYTLNWKCTRPDLTEGILREKKRISISIPNSSISALLNPT